MSEEGCRLTWTHDMKYLGQGYWRCERCGWEAPQQPEYASHTHDIEPQR